MPRAFKLKERAALENTTVEKLVLKTIDEQGSIKEAARELKVSRGAIYWLIHARDLVIRRPLQIVPREDNPADGV